MAVVGVVVWGGVGAGLVIAGLVGGAAGVALAAPIVNAEGTRGPRRRVAVAALVIAMIACALSVVGLLIPLVGEPLNERPDADQPDVGAEESTEDRSVRRVGQPGTVASYTVTVDAVVMDADEALAAADPANPAPSGQYVLVDVTVAYRGMSVGNPADELAVHVLAADAATYWPAAECAAVTDRPLADIGTMEFNTTATFSVCVDMPPTALPATMVLVEDLVGDDPNWKTWSID